MRQDTFYTFRQMHSIAVSCALGSAYRADLARISSFFGSGILMASVLTLVSTGLDSQPHAVITSFARLQGTRAEAGSAMLRVQENPSE